VADELAALRRERAVLERALAEARVEARDLRDSNLRLARAPPAGLGRRQRETESLRGLRKAAAGGDQGSQLELGLALLEYDSDEALQYLKLSADSGNHAAQAAYGENLRRQGFSIVPEIARYLKMAADGGDRQGMLYYSEFLRT
jgi:TPR repeat protein